MKSPCADKKSARMAAAGYAVQVWKNAPAVYPVADSDRQTMHSEVKKV